MAQDHGDVVRREFERQRESFAAADSFFARGDLAGWIGAFLPLAADDEVLDVCGGAGHLSRALADRANRFVVLDLTRSQLEVGRAAAVPNVDFVEGDAAAMPFDDGAFDLAMSRFAFHHLPDQAAVAREMARVVKPGGHLAIMDMVSGGARHDELEILRDPSHTRAFSEAELDQMLEAVGAEVIARDERRAPIPAEPWLRQASPTDEQAARVRSALEAEADGAEPTGLQAHRDSDGVLHIAQRWLLVVAALRGIAPLP